MRRLSRIVQCSLFILLAAWSASSCTERFEDRCRREAREYTEKQCPRRLDDFVTIDSMTYVEQPQGFAYCYSLNDEESATDSIPQEIIDQFVEQMRQRVRNDLTMKSYKEKGFTFTYRYFSHATGVVLFEASFGPKDYQ